MVDVAFYLVTEDIARRSGVIQSRYRTSDGKFILDNKDLSNIRLTSEEFVNGLEGVEMISKDDAIILIKENHYTMGVPENQQTVVETPSQEEEPNEEETQEEETPSEEEVVQEEEETPEESEQETGSETNNEQEE